MSRLALVWSLILKDVRIEFRNKYSFYSIGFYLIALVYIAYSSSGETSAASWNALLWIILLFTLLVSVGRSFIAEDDRSLYYYFLVDNSAILLAKICYHTCYSILLITMELVLFQLFLPATIDNFLLFILNLSLGAFGISTSLLLVSLITTNTRQQGVMMAVLGFPLLLPVLIIAVRNSKLALEGKLASDIASNLTYLISLDVIIIALVFILFPYAWKN